MNKFFSVLFFILLMQPAWAKPKQFLICLGKEEAYYHKNKLGGAYSKLNQQMISAVVQLSHAIGLNAEYEKQVCSKKFVSLELLKFLLIGQKPIFIISTSMGKNIQQNAVNNNAIKELHEKSVHIFIDFILSIQSQMNKADCLVKKIPELKEFMDDLRYTIEEVGPQKIFKKIKKPEVVFKKLQKISLKSKC